MLTRDGSLKMEESTLSVRNCLKLFGALSLKLLDKFLPTFEKNSLIICCLSLILQPLRLIVDAKELILEQCDFPKSNCGEPPTFFECLLCYFSADLRNISYQPESSFLLSY